jgi:glycosyltransferase involved in cell wall biosynthesis
MSRVPRVALFTDSYYEANGVARTANSLEAFAAERERPMLVVHGGNANQFVESGSIARLELARWKATSFALDHDLQFDVALWRQTRRVADVLKWFQPDVLHVTGPSDVGQIGAMLARRFKLPMVGSWHTNIHEYASRRLLNQLAGLSERRRMGVRLTVESRVLALSMPFYRIPRALLAPNEDWQELLERRTHRPTFVMTRGVDTAAFTPAKRTRAADGVVNIGYVGRLSVEKNVRALAAVHDALGAAGAGHVRFTIVGHGAERGWLESRIPGADFTGVLRGEDLARAYANMDLFVFPSETETVGNVLLEAMASGVPIVAMARGGPKYIAASPASAALAGTEAEFVDHAFRLVHDTGLRTAMGVAARAAALERSWSAVFDVVYHAYDVALGWAAAPDALVNAGEAAAFERATAESRPAA